MIAKIVVLCAAFAAVSCMGVVNTGVSSRSRVQDGKGNYAFEYGIASAGAKRSRAEVGSGWAGPIKTSYAVADNHIAPIAPVIAGPVIAAAPLGLGLGGVGLGLGGIGLGGLGGVGLGGLGGVGLGGVGLGGLGLGGVGLGGIGHGGIGLGGIGLGGIGLGAPGLGLGVGKLI